MTHRFSRGSLGALVITPFLYLIAAAAGVCVAVSLMLLGGLAGLLLSGVVALIAYGILMWVFEREQIARSWRLLRGDISLEAA